MRSAALAALALIACGGGAPPRGDLRDVRPTVIARGDVVTVEAEGPVFAVGAPTRVRLDALAVEADARAVSPDRVLVDADALAAAMAGRHAVARSGVTVTQTVAEAQVHFVSPPGAPFDFDLFRPSLANLTHRLADGARIPSWLIAALILLGAAALLALPVPIIGGLVVVWERKISAWMQARIGPNRVGPSGWLQWLADGLKLLMKEDVIPHDSDPLLFKFSPYIAFLGIFLVFMIIPFSSWLVAADLDVGLLFLLSVTSLVVVSIIMGGWSSNSKWSLLGAMRSAAQILSYELPAGLALLTVATLTGSLSMESIVRAQGGAPWHWFLFRNPFLFAAGIIWFIAALAEGNRTPFDLPEAESELVSGYSTEYSGFRFSLFPLVEWVNLFVIGALATTLFLGGWRLPLVAVAAQDASWALQLLGFGVFLVKDVAIIFVVIWLRWTLPRFRVDQMMDLCWKRMVPISIAAFVGVLGWEWIAAAAPRLELASRYVWFTLFGLLPTVYLFRRVQYNRARWRDLDFGSPSRASREVVSVQ